jgi:siderophore synthetase component
VGYVFQEVAKELSPLLGQVRNLSERAQLSDLQGRVENYAQDRDAVVEWAQKQPAYLRAAYNHVIQQGTVDEVADLITRFRQDTGAQRAAPAAAKPKTDLPAATKQAAAALAPVSSKRSAVIRGTDPNDFESAFEEFAGKL